MRQFRFAYSFLFATALLGTEIDLSLDHRFWAFDGPVHAMVATNGTAYVGGEFWYVGATNGAIGAIDLERNELETGWHYVLGGQVYAAVSDQNGGWFVAGSFSFVPEINRKTLIHIRADGSLDPGWDPRPNEDVWSLALDGGTLYVGGVFTSIAGRDQRYLAALDAQTGQLKEWQPNPNARVFAIVISGERLYIGGRFTEIAGAEQPYLAVFDRTTGSLLNWNSQSDNFVSTITTSGDLVYVGGAFQNIGGANRPHLAALNASSARATDWNPRLDGNANAIVAGPSSVYVGGLFKSVGGIAREGLAEIAPNGVVTEWNPMPEFGHSTHIQELLLHGGRLYVGGDFTRIAGAYRSRLAVFDATTGELTPADFGADSIVYTLSTADQKLFVGASGRSVGGVARTKVAALELTTGKVKSWKPAVGSRPESRVFCLALAENTLYLGGEFGAVGTETRSNLGAVDRESGEIRVWAASVRGKVASLVPYKDLILAGGEFSEIGFQPPRTFAAFQRETGEDQGWDFFEGGSLRTMALRGDSVFLGGSSFHFVGTEWSSRGFASLDLGVLRPRAWNPTIPDSQYVNTLILRSNVVYAAGTFTSVNGAPRNRVAALDAESGEVLSWNPGSQASGSFNPLALATSGQTVFIGGGFAALGGKARNGFAAVEATTGSILDATIELRSVAGLHVADNLLLTTGNLGSPRDSGATIVVGVYDLRRLEPVRFTRTSKVAGGMEAEIAGFPGTGFIVESSIDLKEWSGSLTGEIGITGASRVNLAGGVAKTFYRVQLQ